MADRTWDEQNYSNPYEDQNPNRDGVAWSDYPKAAISGGLGLVGDLGAVVRNIGEQRDNPDDAAGKAYESLGKFTQDLFGKLSEDTMDSLSPDAKARIQSTFTDPNFWALNSMALKTANMSPAIAAAVVPSALMPGLGTALAVTTLQGGAMSAGAVTNHLYEIADKMSDSDLYSQSQYYRDLRDKGLSEEEARREWNNEFIGMKPLVAGAFGAIANSLGPAGQVARGVTGAGGSLLAQAGEGVVKRSALGAAEGAVGGALQAGAEDVVGQQGAVEAGQQKEFSPGQFAESVISAGVLGGALGAGISAAAGRAPRTAEEVNPASPDVVLNGNASDTSGTNAQAPNQPTNGTPGEQAIAPSASGQSATPGMEATAPIPGSRGAAQESVAARIEARNKPATTDVVEANAPDSAQEIALRNTTSEQNPEITAAPQPEPVAQPEPASIPPETSVTPEGNRAPEVQAAEPAPVVQPSPEAVDGAARPAGLEPVATQPEGAAIVPPAEARPAGPRILENVQARPEAERYAAQTNRAVQDNIRQMETPEATAPRGRNRTTAEQQSREAVRQGATEIAAKYPPHELENDFFSKNPRKIVQAQRAIMDRARAIVAEADSRGLALPEAFRTGAKDNYNPETLILLEARRLANMKSPKLADYSRFLSRELDVRTGALDQAIADRRAEGDAAMRQQSEVDVGDLTDANTPVDNMNPEAALIARQEAEREAGVKPRQEEPVSRSEVSKEIPPRVQEALDNAMALRNAPAKEPVVEVRKPRKLNKLEIQDRAEQVSARIKVALDEVRSTRERKQIELSRKQETAPAPKLPEKVTELKQRVENARKETNTEPSQAQALAGNYKKGTVSIHGMEVAIENPKGTDRTNKNPEGPAWKVRMQNDYGYIKGTKGADGDPVDVHLGPDHDAAHVYVIDQLDPDTRAFDEHKVMMGFENQTKAIQAYDKAYSDGRGAERVGDVRRMTIPEFKEWVNSNPKRRAGMTEEEARDQGHTLMQDDLDRFFNEDVAPAALSEGEVRDPFTGETARPVSTRSAAETLDSFNYNHLTGVARAMAGTMRNVLKKSVGDVNISVVSPDDMRRLAMAADNELPSEGAGVLGFHTMKGGQEHIFVRADVANDPAKLQHVITHEVVHAATVRALNDSRELRVSTNRIIDGVVRALYDSNAFTADEVRTMRYGVSNPAEFVAEAMSNPAFQTILGRIPATPDIISHLGMQGRGVRSLWDALVSSVRRALKMPEGTHSMLEAAMRVTERTIARNDSIRGADGKLTSFLRDGDSKTIKDAIKETVDNLKDRRDLAPTKGNPQLLGFRTFDSIARAADRYFKGNNVVRSIANIIEGQRVAAIKEMNSSAPTIQKLYELNRKYKGKQWEDFTSLVHDETMAGVYADKPLSDQKQISKGGAADSWKRAQYPELNRRWQALPDDLKQARTEAMDYFTAKQNEMSLKLIRNRIATLFDTADPEGLAQRIHDGSVTDADKALMGDAYDVIAAAGTLSKINGPYVPLMRRGNFVVKGVYKIAPPAGAKAISANEFEFTSQDAASKWAETQQGRPTMRTVYVDKNTGETHGVENGREVRLTAQDINAEPRYRVVVQDRHMEMFDTMAQARDRVAELRKMGIETDDAVPRSFENHGIQADALSTQMRRLATVMERRADDRGYTPTQKEELLQTLNEVAINMMGATRIQSRSLPRQYVQGASHDLVRNITDYAHAAGNYIAKLDYRPQLDTALAELSDAVKQGSNDGLAAGRTMIQNEILRRVTTPNPMAENKTMNALTSRMLAVSFLDKLMSPSYSVINATQPFMTTAPYLAGQYGIGKAAAHLTRAYREIGTLKALKEGVTSTGNKFNPKNTNISSDPVSLIRNRLSSAKEQNLIDQLVERGVIDADSGLEVSKLAKSTDGITGKFDAALGYTESIARQMPKTIEAINRTVSALAAYRLEMERSGDHARAIQFAQDAVNLTQFNYSKSNAAPFMNHPLLRLAFQFKKYGAGMYQMLGEQAAIAYRNENPGDRARAIKSLSYTIGMHVMMAGAMGLPTEPLKMAVLAANGLGLTDWTWADVEDAQREMAASIFGKDMGEIISRGLPRAAGIDLSSRMGIDTLIGPFGEPRSNQGQDWKAYMWDSFSGAPVGLMGDWASGVSSLAQGDFAKAAEKLVPIKTFSDVLKAYRMATEGSVSKKSGQQMMSPYSTGEAIIRGLGFQPAREAESYERTAAFNRAKDERYQERQQFMKDWVNSTGATRGRVWRDVVKWNKSQPAEARLSLSELKGYQSKMERAKKETDEGIRARNREQSIKKRVDQTYNYN